MRITLKTMIGLLAMVITRYTPFDLSRPSLEGIFNYLPISESLLTGGQPTEAQLQCVRDAGYRHVINLAPHDAENALPNERQSVESLGIEYTHIPVDFKRPTEADFRQFCQVMEEVGKLPVLVHCAANMRVSAFVYRYRRDVLHASLDTLTNDLHKIWQPFGVWKDFIASPTSEGRSRDLQS
jgi:protein tyrosine phosphatase (PTP) superfamily phosphohydrolase (DUF442 family)